MRKWSKPLFMWLIALALIFSAAGCDVLEEALDTAANADANTEAVSGYSDDNNGIEGNDNDIVSDSGIQSVKDGELNVYFLDVGQGDSILITFSGESMLIDCGEKENVKVITGFLQSLGISEITHVVATHPHSDHIGAMADVIRAFGVKNIHMPEILHDTKTFENLLDAIEEKGLEINSPAPGSTIKMGEAVFTVLAPIKETDELNNNSIVMKLEYGESSFLFTGDAEKEVERDILENYADLLLCDVLKAPHHGSSTSSSKDYINAINPKYAVILLGNDNSYNHPHKETVELYNSKGIEILRTDKLGLIKFTTDGTSLTYTTDIDFRTKAEAAISLVKYIGNKNSLKFHLPTCSQLPSEKNIINFYTREQAVTQGYEPCKTCNP